MSKEKRNSKIKIASQRMQQFNLVLPPIQQTVRICGAGELEPGQRMVVAVGGRNIFVTNQGGKLLACDNACYHHGMPLQTGDIEELAGNICLTCPWHKYVLSLETGEGFYWGLEPVAGGGAPPRKVLKSKGPRQRLHTAFQEGNDIFLTVDTTKEEWSSDEYACKVLINKPDQLTRNVQGRSGGSSGSGGMVPNGIHSSAGDFAGGGSGSSFPSSGQVFLAMRAPTSQLARSLATGSSAFSTTSVSNRPPPGRSTNAAAATTPSVSIDLRCVGREPACPDRSAFSLHFDALLPQAANALLLRPGMWVKLRIDVAVDKEDSAICNFIDRQYTICSTGHGSLFSITVRHLEPSPFGGGGVSHFLCSSHHQSHDQFNATLLETGGDFHYHAVVPAALRTPTSPAWIVNRDNDDADSPLVNILWLTAGIGITPLVGFLNAFLAASGGYENAVVASKRVRIVVCHSEKRFDSLVHFELLRKALQHKQILQLALFLTQESEEENTVPKSVRDSLARMNSSDGGAASSMIKYGRMSNVAPALAKFRLGSPDLLSAVMICGPDQFMKSCAAEINACGLPADRILKEAFE